MKPAKKLPLSLSVRETRANLAEILRRAEMLRTKTTVVSNGRPVAVIGPVPR